MKNLRDLTYDIQACRIHGGNNPEISDLFLDSRQITQGGLFAAIKGLRRSRPTRAFRRPNRRLRYEGRRQRRGRRRAKRRHGARRLCYR